MRTHGAVPAALLLAIVTLGRGAQAQQPTPVAATTRADSMTELARLDSLVATRNTEARVWHARGLLAWQLSQGRRAIGIRVDGEQMRLNWAADSSLVAAVTLEPTNVRYLVDVAMYRSQGSPMVRAGATRFVKRAFEAARAGADSMAVAQMADALGKLAFKDYQAMFGRRISLGNGPGASIADILGQQSGADGRSVSASADIVREAIQSRSSLVGGNPPPGVAAYEDALDYFETATRAAPSLPLPWRHRFAALSDRQRWEELEATAGTRLSIAPWDPDAWLAIGLARHRIGQGSALAAFDSAFAQMADSTRSRLDDVERIMRPKAVKALEALPPAERARTERFVWTAADPLWSVPGNEVRAEYLARVAFAELRYSDEELGMHGVDTFPGDLHVRYGFPKLTANYSCAAASAEPESTDQANQVCWLWWYAPRLQFIVHYQAAFNRFRAGFDDVAINEDIRAQAPAAWTDIPGVPAIDSIPLRVARFRPDGTSPSVLVSGAIPLQRMAEGGVRATAATARLWIFADGADAVARDSTHSDASGLALWKFRAPAGDLYARAEAVTPGAGAARGTVFSPGVGRAPGLGMSDVLIAASVADGASPALRWHEFVIAPAPDTLPRTRGIAIAWETYGLSVKDGVQRYAVRLVLEKASKSIAGRIVAQIGGLVNTQRGNDKVTLGFERTGAARDVALDHFSLSLREAPAGRYTLTVEIVDIASGASTRRSTTLLIGP
ncbi:MAG: GWxTD domain-containing protein [Gemmatimonadota bacterium]